MTALYKSTVFVQLSPAADCVPLDDVCIMRKVDDETCVENNFTEVDVTSHT